MRYAKPLRGFSVLEMMIAVSLSAVVFGFGSFLLFVVTRNFANTHDQVLSQTRASQANETVSNLMRRAVYFSAYKDDLDGTSTITRVRFAVPATKTTVTTGTVAYHRAKREIRYYNKELSPSEFNMNGDPTPTPTKRFPHVWNFEMTWQNEYCLVLRSYFQYRGFALMFSNPGNPQYGQFITEIQARNHFFDQREENYGKFFAGPGTL